jgi:copper resistance protein B
MKRLLILLAASSLAAPAAAQHHGHHPPGHAAPASKAKPKPKPAAKAKPAAKKPPARPAAKKKTAPRSAPKKAASNKSSQPADPHAGHGSQQSKAAPPPATTAPAPVCTPEHAAMGHCTMAPQPADPHAGHGAQQPSVAPPPATTAPAAICTPEHAAMGHCTIVPQSADPHAGHAMPGATAAEAAPPVAPPPPEAFQGPENAAETVFDPALFRRKRQEELIDEHGGFKTWMFLADQLEYRIREGGDGYKWDIQGWYGGDYDKLWLKSEGEGEFGKKPEQIELQALYSRAIDPWWNFQAGIRHDFRPDPERTHLVVGIQGLAPYWFEVDSSLFLSNKGDLTARFEAEYDQRITNQLILQPAVEFNLSAQDVPEIGIGSGLSSIEAGLRLRYEFVPEFAPYIGVEYERAFGDTADFRRAEGEDAGSWSLLAGVRVWF